MQAIPGPSENWGHGEITARELVDTVIPAAWRGYDPTFVNKLLERAAATIERLQALDEPTLEQQRREGADLMQRALMLAQATADDAVADAGARAAALMQEAESRAAAVGARAATLIREAEAKATRIVGDAEQIASHLIESEQARAQAMIGASLAVRDVIDKDVDGLERFAARLRGRLRSLLREETEALDGLLVEVTRGRPAVHEIGIGDMPAGSADSTVHGTQPVIPPAREDQAAEAASRAGPGEDGERRSGVTG